MSSTGKVSIFLVEDEDRLRNLVKHFLKDEGFDVIEAADGGEAVEIYRTQGPFDLILLDLNLPVFSGVEVCRQIKQIEPRQRIVICSAAVVQEHETALTDLGVTRFLTKPYHPDDLIQQIQEVTGENANRPIWVRSVAASL